MIQIIIKDIVHRGGSVWHRYYYEIFRIKNRWQDFHNLVWKEIVSRFGQSEYDDETKNKKHIETLKAEWEGAEPKEIEQKPIHQ